MNNKFIFNLTKIVGENNIFINESMCNHTSIKIGGPVDVLVTPDNAKKISTIIKECNAFQVNYFAWGNGSNVLVSDKGIRGVVIKLAESYSNFYVRNQVIWAESGILLSKLAEVAALNSLSGFEFACGIPGCLGGAVSMNAGAYGGEMKDIIIKTRCLDKFGEEKIIKGERHEFGYRTSFISKNKFIVLNSEISLKKGDKSTIYQNISDLNTKRKEKQPLDMPSFGSVFKRPEGHYTGKLIEDCGLVGYKIGGAEVSKKHCGFIVNAGDATCDNVISLIHFIQNKVKEKFGVDLIPEVKIVGEF